MDKRLVRIRDRVALLGAVDNRLQVFGANAHRYTFAVPLSETELAALEARIGELPAEYRALVLRLGAAGAGPYYGVVPHEFPDGGDPTRAFTGANLDGTLVLAEQGCGGRSLLVLRGPRRGQVWSDWTRASGTIDAEAPDVFAWYDAWLDRALIEWAERAAPRIALDGPDIPEELEAVTEAFDLLVQSAPTTAPLLRTLGYLHLRERRYDDAAAAFDGAAAAEGADEPEARRLLDLARLQLARGDRDRTIVTANRGLALPKLWYSTQDELRDTLERALSAAGRADEALAVLDLRAAECFFDYALHHRLARERLARNDAAGAGGALERAAAMPNIGGPSASFEDRLAGAFDPIIAELLAGGRTEDAEVLATLVDRIKNAN